MANRAAIYARVSTDTGKQDTDRQITKLVEIAQKKGYKAVDVFSDNISGYIKDRPELGKLLNVIESNPKYYSLILVDEISRIGRNPIDARNIIDNLSSKGVPIFLADLNQYTIDYKGQRNSIINIMLQLSMEYANMESQQMKQRSHDGRLNKAKKGEYMGGIMVPYGYDRVNKKLEINEGEATHIRQVFQWCADGHGCNYIARQLNNSNVPTKRAILSNGERVKVRNMLIKPENLKWHYLTIRNILRNSLYMGERKTMGITVDCPSIVSKELFDRAQLRLNNTKHSVTNKKYCFMLKGQLYCSICGRIMSGRYNGEYGKDKFYCCLSRSRGTSCGNGAINIDYLESVMYDVIVNNFIKANSLTLNDDVIKDLNKIVNDLNVDFVHFQQQRKSLTEKSKKLLDIYLEEDISKAEFESKRNEIDIELKKVEIRINELQKQLIDAKSNIETISKKSDVELLNNKTDRLILKDVFDRAFDRLYILKLDREISFGFIKLYGGKYAVLLLTTNGYYGRQKKNYKYKFIPPSLLMNNPVFDERDNTLVSNTDTLLKEFRLYEWDNIPQCNTLCFQDALI
jgi:site-specific DNA recombinase